MDIGRYSRLLYHDWVKDQALTLGVGYEYCTRKAYQSHNFIGHAYRLPRSVISVDSESVALQAVNVQTKLKARGRSNR